MPFKTCVLARPWSTKTRGRIFPTHVQKKTKGKQESRTHRFAIAILDDCAAVAAAVRAKNVAAVPAMMLADQEREVRVAALAPENGFVLNPARPAVVLD